MKVFLTGATGYIGTVIAEKLQAAGHTIIGLARTDAAAETLKKWDIEPFLGDLQNPSHLIQAVHQADGVIHTKCIHDLKNWANAVQIERNFIATINQALAGSGKPFIATSDTGVLGDTGLIIASENYPIAKRAKLEEDMLRAAQLDIRSVVLRLPIYIYGRNNGTSFTATLIQSAFEMGVAQYIQPGNQLVSTAHVDDVAQLYVLALEKAPAGSLFHSATQSGITVKSIAKAIANNIQCDTEGICFREAVFNWGHTVAKYLAINNQTSANKAILQLGWQPQVGKSLLEDIKSGFYSSICYNLNDLTRLDMLRMLYTQPITT